MGPDEFKGQLEIFFTKFKLVKYKKGEIILRPGEKLNYVGYSKSGFTRMYTLNENGQEVTLLFFRPIFYFTVMYSMSQLENNFYFEAITPTEIYEAPIDEAKKFFREHEDVAMGVMGMTVKAMVDQIEHMSLLLASSAYSKVAAVAGVLASRSQENASIYATINFKITHKLIASLTGLTRETVTLQMLRLEKEGLIKTGNKKVEVLDKTGLLKAAKQEE
jgi:CRP/FNR family transcriptional regulator, cyclic AMP receptor protein